MAFIDQIVAQTDSLYAVYAALKTGADNTKTRLATMRDAIDDLEESTEWQNTLGGMVTLRNKCTLDAVDGDGTFDTIVAGIFNGAFDGLDSDCARYATANSLSGVTTLKTYLQYMNYGGGVVASAGWGYLMAPGFSTLYAIVQGGALGAKLTFAPAINDMGSKSAGGSFAEGADSGTDFVDGTIVTSKYAGAKTLNLTSASITGSGTVTVVGNGYGADGTLFTGHTWTLAVSGNTTAALVPSITGDICYKVTAINIPAGITVGDLTVKCAAPRTNPPT